MAAALGLAGCAAAPPAPSVLTGDAAHPAVAAGWLRVELYFGVGTVAGDGSEPDAVAHEKRWRDFLDREVSPRFPDGLSVYDVYGQWRSRARADIERLHSKELMLLCEDTPQHRADMEAIRVAWKKLTGDESVLRVIQRVDVSF